MNKATHIQAAGHGDNLKQFMEESEQELGTIWFDTHDTHAKCTIPSYWEPDKLMELLKSMSIKYFVELGFLRFFNGRFEMPVRVK